MDARLKTKWRDAQRRLAPFRVRFKRIRQQLRQYLHTLRPQVDRQLLGAIGFVLLLGICSVAAALPARHLLSDPNTTANAIHHGALTPTPKTHGVAIKPHATVTPQPKPTAQAHLTPTVVPASTPSEAQTPLHLSDPNASTPSLTANTPWWQSLLDVTWKLALVVGLIYLTMRALVALKQRGFSPKQALGGKKQKQQRHFFEQIEEMQLAPQHVLHAVRAGDRIFLIARTQGALRALGEVELSEISEEATTEGSSSSFADQMFRAWAGFSAKQAEPTPAIAAQAAASSSRASTIPVNKPKESVPPTPDVAEDVIDAKWVTVKPNVAPVTSLAMITAETATIPPLPLKRGTTRDSTLPPPPSEPLGEALEREILWYAEEHNDSAAAKKYGMTRQRVTAMRMRMERERLGRLLEEHRRERDSKLAQRPSMSAATISKREERPLGKAPLPAAPDHPRSAFMEKERLAIVNAQGGAARAAYSQNTGPKVEQSSMATAARSAVKPDVVPTTNMPKSDAEEQAITVGQILAARFGIKIPATK